MNKEVKERFNKNKENMEFYDQDGTVTKKKKFVKKPRAQKIKPITYTYTSESVFDVLDNMCGSCNIVRTFIDNVFSDYTQEEIDALTSDDIFRAIAAHVINSSMPRLIDKKFIHSSLSVSANKVYVRTEGNVAFTIELKYQIVEKHAEITSCTGNITLFAKNDKLVDDLVNSGFTKVEK